MSDKKYNVKNVDDFLNVMKKLIEEDKDVVINIREGSGMGYGKSEHIKYNKCEICGFESNSDWDFMTESKPLRCIECFKKGE